MTIHLRQCQDDGKRFDFLVFEEAIIPVAQIKNIQRDGDDVVICQPDGSWFRRPCTGEQWAQLKRAFTEGV